MSINLDLNIELIISSVNYCTSLIKNFDVCVLFIKFGNCFLSVLMCILKQKT